MATWLCTSLQDGGLTRYGLHTGLSNLGLFNGASLDIRFADTESLTDAVTGQSLVTFTRASSGTSVGSDGLIKTATTNLLLQSEDFGTTWTRLVGLQFTANQAIAPNGLTTADLLAGDGTQIGYLEQPTSSSNQFVSGLSYTFSVYLKKANTSTALTLLYGLTFNSGGSNPIATWNLDTGVPSFSNGCTGSMTAVGNGWYRCVVTDTATATETRNQQWLRMSVNAGDVYAWGAQLEQSSTVGEYIPTTSTINSAPRFDHNPTTGESLGLLVEEQRTNLLLRSEEFDSASWVKIGSVVSANAIASPSGAITADLLREDAFVSIHEVYQSNTGGAATYALSVFFKNGSGTRHLNLGASRGASDWISCRFNPANGTASVVSIEGGSFTSASAQVISIGNGWYRGALTFTSSGLFATQVALSSSSAAPASGTFGVETYQGDGTSGIYLWGAQLEAGAFPTSYIPTTTAAATRSADVASITGTAFSSWYRQDEGTVFAEAQLATNRNYSGTFRHLMQATPASNNDSAVGLFVNSANQFSLQVRNNNANQAVIDTGTNSGLTHRVAGVYKVDDFAISANGGSAAVDISGSAPTTTAISQMTIGGVRDGNTLGILNGTIRRLTYWPQRLPNSTLQAITQ